MHKHIVRLLGLIAIFALISIAARAFFTDDSFYQYGHYRGNSPAEIASKVPKVKGSASCQSCHKGIYAEWVGGIHRKGTKDGSIRGLVVKYGPNCEVCHTAAAGNHPSKETMPLSIEDKVSTITHLKQHTHATNVPGKSLLLSPEDARSVCLNCHEKMPGRPLEQKQIEIERHAGVEMCVTCHNPHSPKIDFASVPRLVAMQKVIPGNAKAGKEVAKNCAACHGVAGVSLSPAMPNLAGQHAVYMDGALRAFKSKSRDNVMMSTLASGMSDADMQNVAAYYAQASCKVTGGDKSKIVAGKSKAEEAGCAACHHSRGLHGSGLAGVSASQVWPNLAGQNADYLASTLKGFKDGSRYHSVMTSVAKTLGASDIDNLAAYYASVNCK